jgi:hypothetical protein
MAEANDLFIGLIASLQASAWMLLGKVMHPMTGKIERNLEQAKETIDLLGVLEEKTAGNLHPDEARLLQHVLYELRLNYVDELKAAAAAATPAPPSETPQAAATPPPPDAAQSNAEAPPSA